MSFTNTYYVSQSAVHSCFHSLAWKSICRAPHGYNARFTSLFQTFRFWSNPKSLVSWIIQIWCTRKNIPVLKLLNFIQIFGSEAHSKDSYYIEIYLSLHTRFSIQSSQIGLTQNEVLVNKQDDSTKWHQMQRYFVIWINLTEVLLK